MLIIVFYDLNVVRRNLSSKILHISAMRASKKSKMIFMCALVGMDDQPMLLCSIGIGLARGN